MDSTGYTTYAFIILTPHAPSGVIDFHLFLLLVEFLSLLLNPLMMAILSLWAEQN
jgi:hypothetical protein